MNKRAEKPTLKLRTTLTATWLILTVVLVPLAPAADEVAGRNVGHTQKVEMMEVGDVPGHIMGVSRFHGLSFYTKGPEQGEVIPRMGTMNFDAVNGKGTFSGHESKTFSDGSMSFVDLRGTQTPIDGGKKVAIEGTWEAVGGTGKYAGGERKWDVQG